MASRSGSLCERGRGGSLCGWRPKALIPVGPWASGADRPRPLPMPSLLGGATPTRGGDTPRSSASSAGGSSSAARIVDRSGIVRASTFVSRPYAVSRRSARSGSSTRRASSSTSFLPRGPGDSAEVNVHIVPPDDPVAQLSSDLLERASLVGDAAISFLVSEDSRLVDTVRQCKALGHRCGVGIPSASFHRQFQEHAAFYKRIRKRALMASLLDDPIQSARGPLSKPRSW